MQAICITGRMLYTHTPEELQESLAYAEPRYTVNVFDGVWMTNVTVPYRHFSFNNTPYLIVRWWPTYDYYIAIPTKHVVVYYLFAGIVECLRRLKLRLAKWGVLRTKEGRVPRWRDIFGG